MLRGTGKQKFGAIANAIGYYAIGFPLGISLMFAAKLGVLGTCAVSRPGAEHPTRMGHCSWQGEILALVKSGQPFLLAAAQGEPTVVGVR